MLIILRMRLLLTFVFAAIQAAKILVLYENPQVRISHSKALTALEEHGFDLTYKVRNYNTDLISRM